MRYVIQQGENSYAVVEGVMLSAKLSKEKAEALVGTPSYHKGPPLPPDTPDAPFEILGDYLTDPVGSWLKSEDAMTEKMNGNRGRARQLMLNAVAGQALFKRCVTVTKNPNFPLAAH